MVEFHAPRGWPPELAAEVEARSAHCFGCGPANPWSLKLVFAVEVGEDGGVRAEAPVRLTRLHEGPPGFIHGGVVAALMDEAMGKLMVGLGTLAVTRHMEVDYLRPSPLETDLRLVGAHVRRDGRKIFNRAELLGGDGVVLARATGLFLEVDVTRLAEAGSGAK